MLRFILLGLIGALGGACSFDTGGQSAGAGDTDASTAGLDAAAGARPDAGGGASDAGLDAAVGPELVEHIDVPVQNAPIVASNTTLTTGTTYELRASGTIVLSDTQDLSADAEYWWADATPGTTMDTAALGDDDIDIGLAINDTVVDDNANPDWGAFAATHIYSFTYVGEGTTITAQFHDLNAANNSGTLSLDIYTVPE